jgi:hypothetical protein
MDRAICVVEDGSLLAPLVDRSHRASVNRRNQLPASAWKEVLRAHHQPAGRGRIGVSARGSVLRIEMILVPVDSCEHSAAAIDRLHGDQIDPGAIRAYAAVFPENLCEELCVVATEQLEADDRSPTRTRD